MGLYATLFELAWELTKLTIQLTIFIIQLLSLAVGAILGLIEQRKARKAQEQREMQRQMERAHREAEREDTAKMVDLEKNLTGSRDIHNSPTTQPIPQPTLPAQSHNVHFEAPQFPPQVHVKPSTEPAKHFNI